MWIPVHDWRSLSLFHMQPTEDASDGPGNMVHVWDDGDVNADGNYGEGNPAMIDTSKIEQDYTRDIRWHKTQNKITM